MLKLADSYASLESLDDSQRSLLCELGRLLNYNGYGASIDDLFFSPAYLYSIVSQYNNPFDFIKNESAFKVLQEGYLADMGSATRVQPDLTSNKIALYILPDQSWARRICGVFANQLAEAYPERAHALLSHTPAEEYLVSVRAPLKNCTGADELCRQFPTGGGRKAAAGINRLPENQYEKFVDRFAQQFS